MGVEMARSNPRKHAAKEVEGETIHGNVAYSNTVVQQLLEEG